MFSGELNPVAPKAQKKVPIPDGLDLDAWINTPPSDGDDSPSEPEDIDDIFLPKQEKQERNESSKKVGRRDSSRGSKELTQDEINKVNNYKTQ